MKLRGAVFKIVGVTQGVIGALAVIFAYLLYSNNFGLQDRLNISGDLPLYLLVLILFGLFSIISGFCFICEK
jgi:multisubunit Na+/H+ antiporter MnhB subunit